MSDLTTLCDGWGTPEPPSHAARTQARAALLARTTDASARRRLRLPRPGLRLAAVGATAAAIAAGVTALDVSGVGTDSQPAGLGVEIARAAQVLERAAAASETKPFTAPRPDQWIYTVERFTGSQAGEPKLQHAWRRADGGGMAWIGDDGQLQMRPFERPKPQRGRPAFGPLSSYESVAALPTDPDALLRWAYEQATHITNGPDSTDDGEVYLLLNNILRSNVLRPELEAGTFRAMKQIPGVTVATVDIFGRPALALGLDTADWLHEELLLDPETYAYRGERSTVIQDATIDPAKAGNATGEVKKGSQVIVERVRIAIVDEPGARG